MGGLTLQKSWTLLGVGKKLGTESHDIPRSKGSSWRTRLVKALSASFNAQYQSDWEKTTSNLQWKEWAKL